MLTDDELIGGFEAGSLQDFPHASHVRLTLIYLSRHGRDGALERLMAGLLRFATAKGQPEKFHVTMTRAWVDLIDAARRSRPELSAAALVDARPELLDRGALLRFYSTERLNSPEARTHWVPPDLQEIDRI